jgi:hypothetical protein
MTSAAPPSIATLFDEVRPLLAHAREVDDTNPRYVLVSPAVFDAITGYRKRDREMGLPVTIMGLEIVRADDPNASPKVF